MTGAFRYWYFDRNRYIIHYLLNTLHPRLLSQHTPLQSSRSSHTYIYINRGFCSNTTERFHQYHDTRKYEMFFTSRRIEIVEKYVRKYRFLRIRLVPLEFGKIGYVTITVHIFFIIMVGEEAW